MSKIQEYFEVLMKQRWNGCLMLAFSSSKICILHLEKKTGSFVCVVVVV